MLYEPTNIIPSTLTQTGTVAQAEQVNIQWQVNGTSALAMFQVDVYFDNTDSTFVYSTGVVSEYPSATGNILPFYGKDRFGDYVPFEYSPAADWGNGGGNSTNWGLVDGNRYKLSILQFYKSSNAIAKLDITSNLTQGSTYYFSYAYNGTTYYVSFVCVDANIFSSGASIYYSQTNSNGWVYNSTSRRVINNLTFSIGTTAPTTGTSLGATEILTSTSGDIFYDMAFTAQNAPAAFITRTAPVLEISSIASPLTSASMSFEATYEQAQGDSLNSVRWRLFNEDDLNTPIDDTGVVYTQVLQYEYNGFFDNTGYRLSCEIETENGITANSSIEFGVQFSNQSYNGDFIAQVLCDEDCIKLSWDGAINIPATAYPEDGYSITNGLLVLDEGATVTWDTTHEEGAAEENMDFASPWTMAWAGNISQISGLYTSTVQGQADLDKGRSAISPDGTLLVVYGDFEGYAALFSVSNMVTSYIGTIIRDGSALSAEVTNVVFSPSGDKLLMIGGGATASIYTVNGTRVTWLTDLTKSNGHALDSAINCINFNSTGTLLILAGDRSSTDNSYSWIYSIDGDTVTYTGGITTNSAYPVQGNIIASALSPNNNLYIFSTDSMPGSGDNTSAMFRCRVSGTAVTVLGYVQSRVNIEAQTYVTVSAMYSYTSSGTLTATARWTSPDGSITSYRFSSGTQPTYVETTGQYLDVTWVSTNPEDEGQSVSARFNIFFITSVARGRIASVIEFSNTGSEFFAGMQFPETGRYMLEPFRVSGEKVAAWGAYDDNMYEVSSIKVSPTIYTSSTNYSVNLVVSRVNRDATPLTYSQTVYRFARWVSINGNDVSTFGDIGASGSISSGITPATFQSFLTQPTVGGINFVTCAPYSGVMRLAAYNIYDSTCTQIGYVTVNGEDIVINEQNGAVFNPEGNVFFVTDSSLDNAAVFTVSSNEISYSSEISADSLIGGQVYASAFSPSGAALVLGGGFAHYASIFSINGTNAKFVDNIRRGEEELTGTVNAAVYNPAGNLLVLGGEFYRYASAFSVSGTNVTYLADITKAGATLTGAVNVAAFSPSGNLLVLGGEFSGYAALFSVSGTTLTYIADITKGDTNLTGAVNTAVFNTDGNLLVLGGEFGGFASVFSVNGTNVEYLGDITESGNPLTNVVNTAAFSPSGDKLVLGGVFNGCVAAFTVDGNDITYLSDITLNGSAYYSAVTALCFNASGNALIIGGQFSGGAAMYVVGDDSIVYASPLKISGAAIGGAVNTLAYSSAGNIVVAAGNFDEAAALYRISGDITESDLITIQPNALTVSRDGNSISIAQSDTPLGTVEIMGGNNGAANRIVVTLTPTVLTVYSFLNSSYMGYRSVRLSYNQSNITALQLTGKQTCDYFAVIEGDGDELFDYFADYSFVPVWNSPDYTLYFLADFSEDLNGGTATSIGIGFRIYRTSSEGDDYMEIATLPSNTVQIKDFGIKSNVQYTYYFYAYDEYGAFTGVRVSDPPQYKQFQRYSLLATEYNSADHCYHVVKEYLFSCNIQDMALSNNSNKSYVQNFTPYPTVFKSTANYASGTLQALIGFVDQKTYTYWDDTALMNELNGLSTTDYTLFLKDMKGHLWMVDVGAVQQTVTQNTREMQVTISLPWTEIGSSEDVSIIQTPEDEGWNYDAQVLDVKLDVDVDTGLLRVAYPYPYNGTAFYLVGVTPDGVTSMVQPLPSVAKNTTDGELRARIRNR